MCDGTPTASNGACAVLERFSSSRVAPSPFSPQRLVHRSVRILDSGSCLSGLQAPIELQLIRLPFNPVKCAELMKAVYLPDPGSVELLLREQAILKSDHQDDDVTPLIIGSSIVPSLWQGVSLTVSLPELGGRVKHELDGVRDGLLDNCC